jgi:hypothetical protein
MVNTITNAHIKQIEETITNSFSYAHFFLEEQIIKEICQDYDVEFLSQIEESKFDELIDLLPDRTREAEREWILDKCRRLYI